MNLAGLLDDAAREHGARPALYSDGASIDFAELQGSSARFARLFHDRGLRPGDRVALLLPNVPAFVAAYYGALRAGAVVVPLNVLLKSGEIAHRLVHSGSRLLVTVPERVGELREVAERHAVAVVDPSAAERADALPETVPRELGETAVLLYTSGTTGGPKGAELTHGGLRWVATCTAAAVLGLSPDDVVLGALSLAHIFGQAAGMNSSIAGGACLVLAPRFEAGATLRLMAQTSTTVFLGVPTMCIALLESAAAIPSPPRLRVAHVGGAPVPVEISREFAASFGAEMLVGYGLTETSGIVVTHHHGQPYKTGSVGTPLVGAEVRVAAGANGFGEVLLHSPGLMRGYWRDEGSTAEAVDSDGWFASGDIGRLDEDGYLYLVDRKKDTILRGGYSVYPFEVEDVLFEHPAVLEAAVVGVPDARLGEEVVALVLPRHGADCDPQEIRDFVRDRIAAYKYPRLVVVVDELPRGPSGKILKREIDRGALERAVAAAREA
jgi:long-chain acyl-CoA synthetase